MKKEKLYKARFRPHKNGPLWRLEFTIRSHTSDHKLDYEKLELCEEYKSLSFVGHSNGAGGQCLDAILKSFEGHVKEGSELERKLIELKSLWDEWHLNDMTAGTRKQETALMAFEPGEGNSVILLGTRGKNLGKVALLKDANAPAKSSYEQRCDFLKTQGLYNDRGYKFGSKWLLKPVPEHIIKQAIKVVDFFSDITHG